MQFYCVLKNTPDAPFEWQKLSVTDPVSGELLTLPELLAKLVPDAGTHLIELSIDAKVLDRRDNSYTPISGADSIAVSAAASIADSLLEAAK